MPRLLLVPDVRGWAWWYRAVDLQAFASPGYQVDVMPVAEVNDAVRTGSLRPEAYDAVFHFSWTQMDLDAWRRARRLTCLVTCGGLMFNQVDAADWRTRSVSKSRVRFRAKRRLPRYDGVVVVNNALYESVRELHDNTVLIPSGVNGDFWQYREPRRYDGRLRVGWCANPRGVRTVKGMAEILHPLMDRLGRDEYDWAVNDRWHETALSREDMREWYADLDVLISTSIIEGTPSPPFEAAACGRAVLATDTGVVADWTYLRQRDLVAPAYRDDTTARHTVEWFAERLRMIRGIVDARGADYLATLGRLLRQSAIANFGYREPADIAKRYLTFIAGDTI